MSIVTGLLRLTRSFTIFLLITLSTNLIQAQNQQGLGMFSPVDPPKALYDISCTVEFDTTSAQVSGTETITFVNNSIHSMKQLSFNWTGDSLQTMYVSTNGEPVNAYFPPSDADPVLIELPREISPGDEIEITVQFQRTYMFESGDDKHMWTDWFPRVYWGMQAQDDFIVNVINKSDFVLVSSGLNDPGTHTYRADNVRRFGMCFMKGVKVTEKTVDDIRVRVIHTPAAQECADLVINTAVDAIAYYKNRFGFYPSKHLNIVQGVDAPYGGYPAATNLVVVHGMERISEREELHWRWITAHEIGHQYWFEYVMPEFPDQIGWLMIGLGIYMDREYMRSSGLAPDKHTGLMNRFIDGVRNGLDTRADVNSDYLDDIGFDFNNVVIHGKGYSIISALNCILGSEVFDRIHNRCLREFAGKRMSGYDFQKICEQESGQNLNWFFDQWVRSARFPAYEIKSQKCTPDKDGYITDITVERTGTIDMPVPVTAYFSDNTQQTKFTERLRPASIIQFESATILDSAVVDAKHEIAMVIPPPGSEELEIRRMLSSLPSRAMFDSLPGLAAKALELDIKQTLFWGQLGRQLYDWGLYEEALAVFNHRAELLEELASEWVVSAYGWQGLLLDLLGRRPEAITAYKKALEIPTDREFSYTNDPVTISHEWLEERLKTPYNRDDGK